MLSPRDTFRFNFFFSLNFNDINRVFAKSEICDQRGKQFSSPINPKAEHSFGGNHLSTALNRTQGISAVINRELKGTAGDELSGY